ncbi:RNA-binding motif protein, X-linked 2 [Chamberlinius hualienensis]
MNPITQTRNLTKLIEREVKLEIKDSASWHQKYKDSAWIFIGGLEYELNEGDIIAVFSQYGEIVNINLVRDKKTGKSKGFCFLCYEDQRSTVLAVDNLNGMKLCKRIVRVDHVENYRVPKDFKDTDEETKQIRDEGCAPEVMLKRGEPRRSKEGTPPMETFIKKERHDPDYDKYERQPSDSHKSRKDSRSRHGNDSRERESEQQKNIKEDYSKSDRSKHDSRHKDKSKDSSNSRHESRSKDRKHNDEYSHESRNMTRDEEYYNKKKDRRNDKESQDSRSKDDHRKESKHSRQSPLKDHKKRDRDDDRIHSHENKVSRRKH